jgi:hypothetical protein
LLGGIGRCGLAEAFTGVLLESAAAKTGTGVVLLLSYFFVRVILLVQGPCPNSLDTLLLQSFSIWPLFLILCSYNALACLHLLIAGALQILTKNSSAEFPAFDSLSICVIIIRP